MLRLWQRYLLDRSVRWRMQVRSKGPTVWHLLFKIIPVIKHSPWLRLHSNAFAVFCPYSKKDNCPIKASPCLMKINIPLLFLFTCSCVHVEITGKKSSLCWQISLMFSATSARVAGSRGAERCWRGWHPLLARGCNKKATLICFFISYCLSNEKINALPLRNKLAFHMWLNA